MTICVGSRISELKAQRIGFTMEAVFDNVALIAPNRTAKLSNRYVGPIFDDLLVLLESIYYGSNLRCMIKIKIKLVN